MKKEIGSWKRGDSKLRTLGLFQSPLLLREPNKGLACLNAIPGLPPVHRDANRASARQSLRFWSNDRQTGSNPIFGLPGVEEGWATNGSYGCSCSVDAGVGGGGNLPNGTASKKKGGLVEFSRIAPKRIQGHPLAPAGIERHSFFMGNNETSCDAVI